VKTSTTSKRCSIASSIRRWKPGRLSAWRPVSKSRYFALEVTSAADSLQRSIYATGFGNQWDAPELAANWQIGIASDSRVDVRKLMGGVEPHLKVLEDNGVAEVGRGFSKDLRNADEAVVHAAQQIFGLGAILARSWSAPKPGETPQFLLSGHGGAGSNPQQVNELVAERAEAKAKKLRAAEAAERHLFVCQR
jgi:hypothetical protein